MNQRSIDAPPGSGRPLPRKVGETFRGLPRRVVRGRGREGSPREEPPPRSAIVDCALYDGGVRRGGQVPLEVALQSAQDVQEGFVWIGLHEPTAEELEAVTAQFGLHPLAVEDAVHAHQRPKLEVYGDTLFAVLKTVRYVDPREVVEIGEVMLFVGPKFVVTVRHGAATPLTEVRRGLEADPELLATGPSAVLYAVADRVVDEYAEAVEEINTDIDEIELQVFSGRRTDPTERLYKLKREVMEFRRAIRPLAAPLERIARGDLEQVDARVHPYFRDVQDHVLRTADQVETFDELLSGALSANTAQIQVRQNEDTRKITAWAAILATNTLLVGIYGMNFVHMPELQWLFGYPLVLASMLLVSVVLYRGFRRNHWI